MHRVWRECNRRVFTSRYTQLSTVQPTPNASNDSAPVIKPFDSVPRVRGYPVIGTVFDYHKPNLKMDEVIKQRIKDYGLIYREKITPGFPEKLLVFRPEDVETVFRADGKWPNNPGHGDILIKLRRKSFETVGVLFGQGEEWHRCRQPMSKFTMVPRKVAEYHEDFNNITRDLLKNIDSIKDPDSKIVKDVNQLLFRWSFEGIAFFALGKRLGNLNSGDVPHDCQEFIKQVNLWFASIFELVFSVPWYYLFETKKWKTTVKSQQGVKDGAVKFITERMDEIREDDKQALGEDAEVPDKIDFLTYLLHSTNLSIEEITSNMVDLLMAGIETTSYTLGWALYCLATNPEAQEKLRLEVQRVVGTSSMVTPVHIDQMLYLRHTLKETLRMFPLTGINQRKLQKDVVLSGYHIPEGTEIMMSLQVGGRMAQYFPDPDSFNPERWSNENKDTQTSQFASLPFGFGTRMCLGRRIAELELHIALAHIMLKYRVEFPDDKPVDAVQKTLLVPDRPVNIAFKDL